MNSGTYCSHTLEYCEYIVFHWRVCNQCFSSCVWMIICKSYLVKVDFLYNSEHVLCHPFFSSFMLIKLNFETRLNNYESVGIIWVKSWNLVMWRLHSDNYLVLILELTIHIICRKQCLVSTDISKTSWVSNLALF